MKKILDRLNVFKRLSELETENAILEGNLLALSEVIDALAVYRVKQVEEEIRHKKSVNDGVGSLILKVTQFMMEPIQYNLDLSADLDVE